MKFEFNINKFYILGIICFIVIILGSSYSLLFKWNFIDAGAKVSSIFSLIFDLGLILMFNFLRKQNKEQMVIPKKDEDEMLKKLKKVL